MSGGDIATYSLDEADAHILFKMVYNPSQVSMHGIVDSDVSVRCVFSANFGVKVVEHWTEEWKDVEAPVNPSGQSLPLFQCKFAAVIDKIFDASY